MVAVGEGQPSPCADELGGNWGSVEVKRICYSDEFGEVRRVKVYPLLTHALKHETHLYLGAMPYTGRQLERRLLHLQKLKTHLQTVQPLLGGYRIELTCHGIWEKMQSSVDFFCTPEGLARCVRVQG